MQDFSVPLLVVLYQFNNNYGHETGSLNFEKFTVDFKKSVWYFLNVSRQNTHIFFWNILLEQYSTKYDLLTLVQVTGDTDLGNRFVYSNELTLCFIISFN